LTEVAERCARNHQLTQLAVLEAALLGDGHDETERGRAQGDGDKASVVDQTDACQYDRDHDGEGRRQRHRRAGHPQQRTS
jgi:hypothetical protein